MHFVLDELLVLQMQSSELGARLPSTQLQRDANILRASKYIRSTVPAVGEALSDAMVVFACAPVADENKHKKETEKVLVRFVCRGGFYDMGSGTSMPTFHAQRTALNNGTQRQPGRWSIKINCSPSTTIGKPQQYP